MNKTKPKIKKRFLIPAIIIGIVIIAGVIFFQFTPLGYRMTVPYRGFTEIETNVFIDNDYSGDKDKAHKIITEAKNRVSDFWGDIQSSPVLIISDDKKTLEKLGGDHDTSTMVLFRAYSYISISKNFLNVDIIAHELTHAELHARLYKGKLQQNLVPTWFDEGIATQNDYREQYGEEAWIEKNNNGSQMIGLDEMDSTSNFYNGNMDTIRLHK